MNRFLLVLLLALAACKDKKPVEPPPLALPELKPSLNWLKGELPPEVMQGTPVSGGTFSFPITDVRSFLRIGELLENTGVMAYDGAVHLIQTKALQTAGATIATVEARHAAFLNFVNGDNPFPAAFDTPKTPAEILAAAKPFIVSAPTPASR